MNEQDQSVRESERIARRNDYYRKHGIRWVITRGVQGLPEVPELIECVREYNSFNQDNDPYGEHDFGSLEWHGETVFWKIDYYDQGLKRWADPMSEECYRVLTIMTAAEY